MPWGCSSRAKADGAAEGARPWSSRQVPSHSGMQPGSAGLSQARGGTLTSTHTRFLPRSLSSWHSFLLPGPGQYPQPSKVSPACSQGLPPNSSVPPGFLRQCPDSLGCGPETVLSSTLVYAAPQGTGPSTAEVYFGVFCMGR